MKTTEESSFSADELLALLRDPTVSAEAIAAEMLDAGARPHPVEALGTARRLLASLAPGDAGAICGLPPGLRGLVVEEAIALRRGELIAALAQSSDKAVVKEAKRAIHLLKTHGVQVESAKPVAAAPVAAPVEELPAFMSAVDGFGERVLFYPCPVRAGVDVAQVVVSDEAGIVSAHLAPFARKEYRKFVQGLTQTAGVLVGEVPRPYVRGLITAALDRHARARRPVPTGFNEVSFALGPALPPQPSPGRQLPIPEDAAQLAMRGAALLALPEFKSWLPGEDEVHALARRLDEILVSPLYLDERQRAHSRQETVKSAVLAFWTAEQRAKVADRLFDIAWLLHGARRLEHAQLAVASGHAVGSDQPLEAVSFAWALFEKVVNEINARNGSATAAPGPSASSLILPP